MVIRFRRPPADLPPAWAELVRVIRTQIENSAFPSLDALGKAMYKRPESSTRGHRRRLSELALGSRFPEQIEIERFLRVCPVNAREEIKVLYATATSERKQNRDVNAQLRREVAQFKSSYLGQVQTAFSSMRLPYPGSPRLVDFRYLYVEPTVRRRDSTSAEVRHINTVVSSLWRVVLLGDPGGGKSTICASVVLAAAAFQDEDDSTRVPFIITLRDATQSLLDDDLSMADLLERWCRSRYEIVPSPGVIEHLLATGRATLILDGLDELIDIASRTRVVEKINAFARMYTTTSMMVTSRTVGYDEVPLHPELFDVLELGQLSPSSIANFSWRRFALDDSLSEYDKERLSKAFLRESNATAADLIGNPLMLGLLCSLYAFEGYIPRNRPDVYEKCSSMLFDRWDRQRNIIASRPFNAHIRGAIGALALWMMENGGTTGVARSRAVAFIRAYLHEKRYEDVDEAEDAAIQFVDFCTGRAWVLTNVGTTPGEELYGFTHRTFLEYFCARQVARLNPTAEELFDRLLPRILNSEWEMVGQLCLQILADTSEDGADAWLSLACDWIDAVDRARERSRLVAFVARSLTFLVPRPKTVRRIVAAAYLEIQFPRSDITNTLRQSAICQCMLATSENLASVSNQLLREIEKSETIDSLEHELLFATYPVSPVTGNPAFEHNGRIGLAWHDFARTLRTVGIDRVSTRTWNWTRQYDFAQGKITLSRYLETGGCLAELLTGNQPSRLYLPSFAAGLLAILAAGPPGWVRNDISYKVFATPEKASDFLHLLLSSPVPWLVHDRVAGNGTIYNPHSFAASQIIQDADVLGLYLVLAAIQADEYAVVKSGGTPEYDRLIYWTIATGSQFDIDNLSNSAVPKKVQEFLWNWKNCGLRTVVLNGLENQD